MEPLIRDATPGDRGAINAIYNHYVTHSTCTFQTEPSTNAERAAWWHEHDGRFPVLVLTEGAELLGWASLSPYHTRCAYRFTVENSVYLRPEHCGRGLGRRLLEALLERGTQAGFHSVIALICAEQEPSVRLHRWAGFREVGRLIQVGYKFDRWLDSVIMQRALA